MFLYLQVLINKKDRYKDKKQIQVATQTYKNGAEFKRVIICCLIQGINNCLQINTYWSYIILIGIHTFLARLPQIHKSLCCHLCVVGGGVGVQC